jgi:thioredoxin 1
MKKFMKFFRFVFITNIIVFVFICCNNEKVNIQKERIEKNLNISNSGNLTQKKSVENIAKVTFIELGSVNCIPCKMMQPVMKKVEEEYKNKVKVIFYDVWKKSGQPYREKYKIRAIPTQIFLDENGKEFFRHTGFLSFEKIKILLTQNGIK